MKKSNKMKLLASLASLAVVATPIATLASCGCTKKAYIYIDESQKTKKLESGARGATYTFTLTDNIVSGDKIEAGTTDVSASQTGYTVNVLDVIYSVNSKEVKVVTAIQPTSNELLKEGASFSFGIAINRTGSKSWTNTITGFKMTYAVPTKTGLTIAEEAKTSYTNPAEAVHSYVFDVGSTISVDSECTFECDITKQESKTEGLSVRFNKATPITDNKQLSANFELIYDGELQEEFKVTFDFTISCVKNGVELWRQSFEDFTLEYMYHQMWIYSEYQWDCTYAGEHEFHIYVVKNKDLHWGGEYQIGIELEDENHWLTVDEQHIVEGTTEQGTSYFDIPVKIASSVEEDAEIHYTANLLWTLPGQEQQKTPFTDLSVTYHKTKINTEYVRTALETEHKSHIFSFKMEDEKATPIKVEVEEFTQISGSQDTSISAIEAEIFEKQINVLTAMSTNILDANAEFKFVIKGTTAEGKSWYQKIGDDTKPMKMYYVDPVSILKKEVQTSLDEETAVIPYQITREDSKIDVGNPKNPKCSDDIEGFEVGPGEENNSVKVTITPKTQLNYNSWVSFDLPFTYEIKQDDLTATGTKTITGLKVTYNGSVIFDEEEPQKVTSPGEKTQNFKFKNLSGLTNITASIEKTSGWTNYEVTAGTPTITKDEIDLPVTINNTNEEFMDSGAYCEFKVTFRSDGWEKAKTIEETFMLTYTSGFICSEREKIETGASKTSAIMQITAPSALKAGEKYSIAVSKNYSSEVKVTLGSLTVSGTTINQNMTISKSGSVLTDGDYTRFDIIIKKLNASGEILACEKMQDCKVTYVAGDITWDKDSWYMYELDPSWPIPRTKAIPVNFTLRTPLASDEVLYWDFASAAKGGSTGVPMWKRTDHVVETDGTKAWIDFFFQNASGFTVGDFCWYDLQFKCMNKNTNEVVWTKTIDWYLYMFAGLIIQQQELTTQTMSADVVFDLTAKIPSEKWGDTIKFTPFIVKKSASKDSLKLNAGNLILDDQAEVPGKKLTQNIYFSNGAVSGDWMIFDIKYLVNVQYDGAAYNTYITIENVKLTKQ